MFAGSLDRRVAWQVATEGARNDAGERTYTWSTSFETWCCERSASGAELIQFGTSEKTATKTVFLQIRWRSGLKVTDRLVYPPTGGRIYDIADIQELGRRDGLEIKATTRTDTDQVTG